MENILHSIVFVASALIGWFGDLLAGKIPANQITGIVVIISMLAIAWLTGKRKGA